MVSVTTYNVPCRAIGLPARAIPRAGRYHHHDARGYLQGERHGSTASTTLVHTRDKELKPSRLSCGRR